MLTLVNAKKKAIDDRLYQQWCSYAQLDVSFDEFKNKGKHKSAETILKDVNSYIEMFNQGYTKVEA